MATSAGSFVSFTVAHKRLVTEGRVPDEVAASRLEICTGRKPGGERLADPCPAYGGEDLGYGSGHCSGCSCPTWPISRMHRPGRMLPGRAWYPVGCPRARFEEHPGRRKKAALPDG